MRISDWSSDVCSSDLGRQSRLCGTPDRRNRQGRAAVPSAGCGARDSLNDGFGVDLNRSPVSVSCRAKSRHRSEARALTVSRLRSTRTGLIGRLVRYRSLSAAPKSAYRSEEHTSELQSLMRISYAVFCLKKKIK